MKAFLFSLLLALGSFNSFASSKLILKNPAEVSKKYTSTVAHGASMALVGNFFQEKNKHFATVKNLGTKFQAGKFSGIKFATNLPTVGVTVKSDGSYKELYMVSASKSQIVFTNRPSIDIQKNYNLYGYMKLTVNLKNAKVNLRYQNNGHSGSVSTSSRLFKALKAFTVK